MSIQINKATQQIIQTTI